MIDITVIKSHYLLFCLEKHAPIGKESLFSSLDQIYSLAELLLDRVVHHPSLLPSPPSGGDIPACEELMAILRSCKSEDRDPDRWSSLIIDVTTLLIILDAMPCSSAVAPPAFVWN